MFQNIVELLFKHIWPETVQSETKVKFDEASMEKLSAYDATLSKLLLETKLAYDTHSFISGDFELRHKMKDIWELQSARTRNDYEQKKEQLLNYCQSIGIHLRHSDL